MAERDARRARVEELLTAARVLRDPSTAEGRRLRARLRETTRLSGANIDLGLERCLEHELEDMQFARLLSRVPAAPRALVLLSANVFVAPLRAIVLGRAAAPRVLVRASRRDPVLAEALAELAPNAFELAAELRPEPGDHYWAYGSDATLASLRSALPSGVVFHGHGSGLGAVVIDYRGGVSQLGQLASAVALDTALFDQRGCLSPRLVCVLGTADAARSFASAVAAELERLQHEVPLGAAPAEELAEQRRFADTARYAFEAFTAGHGVVSLALDGRVVVPPARRNLHVLRTDDATASLAGVSPHLTTLAVHGSSELRGQLSAAFPGARACDPGCMQSPPLDGPVDLRPCA